MGNVITIGVDLAKSVFQVHGVDAEGMTVVRRQLRRRQVLPFFEKLPPCLVGMEACATSHHWARELEQLGHRVRLMPPRYVKAYVKNQKSDAADAEAICEAVTRPTMRFVEIKTTEQQSVLILHRTRQMFGALANDADQCDPGAPRGVRDRGPDRSERCRGAASDHCRAERRSGSRGRSILPRGAGSRSRIGQVGLRSRSPDPCLARSNETSRRLDCLPGVGPLVATALVASVPNPQAFKSGLPDLAAWIGLVPKQNSSGGKDRLGNISKHGNRYLRMLLTVGALAVIRYAETHGTAHRPWLASLLERRPTRVAAVALANKIARMAWVIMARGEEGANADKPWLLTEATGDYVRSQSRLPLRPDCAGSEQMS